MDRKVTTLLGVVFLASLVGLQTSSSTTSSTGLVANKPATTSAEKDSIVVPLSELGPWEASCDYFQSPDISGTKRVQRNENPGLTLHLTESIESQFAALDGKASRKSAPDPQSRWCVPKDQAPDFLIATVPDPVNSHLALEFDRRMDAMAWAAADAGYVNDHFWLPWETDSLKASDDPAKARTQAMLVEMRQSQPGLLIFRPSKEGTRPPLFVFLVGETPTYGLSKEQFQNALHYIPIISSDKNALSEQHNTRILGPSYSGSVHSMLQVLKNYPDGHFRVIPSSATALEALHALGGTDPRSAIVRQEILYDGTTAAKSLLCFVQSKLQIDSKEVAVLSESETVFGSEQSFGTTTDVEKVMTTSDVGNTPAPEPPEQDCGSGQTILRFPREIASLRNAYPDRPLSLSAQGPSSKQQETPFLGLPLRLQDKEVGNTADAVPEFSRNQIPISQEGVLFQIAATIRRKKIRLVEIRATNIFDTLFLASFLREACPDARLAVLETDLMLVSATATIPLEGMLTASTYPLLPLNQEWTRQKGEEGNPLILNFPSQSTEASYNGFLALLNNPPLTGSKLRDYVSPDPSDSSFRPPIWISAVGRNGFVPIALYKPKPDPPASMLWWGYGFDQKGFALPLPSGGYAFLAGTVWVFVLIGHLVPLTQRRGPWTFFPRSWLDSCKTEVEATAGQKFRCLMASTLTLIPQWWQDYFNVEGEEEGGQKLCFLLASTLTLVVICVILFLPIWLLVLQSSEPVLGWHCWKILFSWNVLFSAATFVTIAILLVQAIHLHAEAWRSVMALGGWVLWSSWMAFALVLSIWITLCTHGASGLRSEFFLYRCVDIASGVSPAVPILCLLVAIYLWVWMHQRRIRFWEVRRAEVPTTHLDAEFKFGLGAKCRELDSNLRTLRLQGPMSLVTLLITLAVILLSRSWQHLSSIEPFAGFYGTLNHFNFLCFFLLFWLWAFVFAGWVRFIHCWYLLQLVLSRLERTILRRAFDKLPKRFYSWTPIWQALGGRRSFVVLARSRECLEQLLDERHGDVLDLSDLRLQESLNDNLFFKLNHFFEAEANGNLNLNTPLQAVQSRMRDVAEELVEKLLPYWREKGASDTLDDIVSNSYKAEDAPLPEQIVLAEEFVVLRYMTLIRYVSLHLRNLLSFIMAGFMLGVFALRSYPFLASRAIGWTLTMIFAALGTGVVVVFAQMSKDAILSRIADTEPGEISKDFYYRIVSFGALPVITLLASQFPFIGRFLFSWIQPGIEALH